MTYKYAIRNKRSGRYSSPSGGRATVDNPLRALLYDESEEAKAFTDKETEEVVMVDRYGGISVVK